MAESDEDARCRQIDGVGRDMDHFLSVKILMQESILICCKKKFSLPC